MMLRRSAVWLAVLLNTVGAGGAGTTGYYRQPALHGETLVFVAEGDLWKVPLAGGTATRLTSHPGDESQPAISPDGATVAFVASYEGPREVYTVPLAGGLPTRRTYDAGRAAVSGWTPDGRIIASTDVYSTLPNAQLCVIDIRSGDAAGVRTLLPLAQAADGCFDDAGAVLYFTRLAFQGSHTKRYRGGTAQNLWRFAPGDAEAIPLTADYPGTSKRPMWWSGRVYFASDRDGTMNLWSMKPDGSDLKQHTRHAGWDVIGPSLQGGRIAYQLGADLHVYDIAADTDRTVAIALDSDFDQTREHWVKNPMEYVTAAHLSADGSRVVLTARGQVFVAPHRQGRLVEAGRKPGVRYREARFMPDGKRLVALSDQSGEVELWTLPANGVGAAEQLTADADVLRWEALPSPDGKLIAHHDKHQRLFVYDTDTRQSRKIDENRIDAFAELRWSPDSKWLAYVAQADNMFRQVRLYSVADGGVTNVTSDRYDSFSPAWSPDGKWLYLLSDRNLVSLVASPWGSYQPEPFLDKTTEVYQIGLLEGARRTPFAPADELHPEKPDDKTAPAAPATQPVVSSGAIATGAATASAGTSAGVEVKIDRGGIQERLFRVPVGPGNYGALSVNDKALFLLSTPTGERKSNLVAINIAAENVETKTVVADVAGYEMSQDGKKLLVRKGDALYIVEAAHAPADLDKKNVELGGWMLSVNPREEWRQMFTEAWRLERDYFYDRGMHGVDWQAMLAKYRPLVDRVSTRGELSDLLAQMVSELSALHIFVYGGDQRSGNDDIALSSLGAVLVRDANAGGYRVERIYQSDPDEPERRSPLARPEADVKTGDVIESINGVATLSVPDAGLLLRRQAGRQVLLRVRPAAGEPRDCIVVPLSTGAAEDLRYHDWELSRRRLVDEWSRGEIGYVHLRAMGGGNFTEWAKGYFPVFTRKGLIVDVRHNRGGNIDSWIIGRLMRKAWFYWNQHWGHAPSWNMQYAFRGHVAVLCNERTASDGEAFSEGVKRLALGKVIGTRTWGGEIWLSSSNFLVDKGIATAAEYGVYGPQGEWLIEGHGVDPDIVVDNLPHATFKGEDAQLRAAVDYLLKTIREKPVETPPVPKFPDKSK